MSLLTSLSNVLFEQQCPVSLKSLSARFNESFPALVPLLQSFVHNHADQLYLYFLNTIETSSGNMSVTISDHQIDSHPLGNLIDSTLYCLVPKLSHSSPPSFQDIICSDFNNTPFRDEEQEPMVEVETIHEEPMVEVDDDQSPPETEVKKPTTFLRQTITLIDDSSDFDVEDDEVKEVASAPTRTKVTNAPSRVVTLGSPRPSLPSSQPTKTKRQEEVVEIEEDKPKRRFQRRNRCQLHHSSRKNRD
ncbi:hypothetical protein GEMRC1_012769 [Eukaryota sp. GEM-RC1]